MADASFPDRRARSNPGTAIAAMMPMMATTISSSISVNPSFFLFLTTVSSATTAPRLWLFGRLAARLAILSARGMPGDWPCNNESCRNTVRRVMDSRSLAPDRKCHPSRRSAGRLPRNVNAHSASGPGVRSTPTLPEVRTRAAQSLLGKVQKLPPRLDSYRNTVKIPAISGAEGWPATCDACEGVL